MSSIKDLRKRCGLTQKEASCLTNIPLRTYKNYENDERKIGSVKHMYIIRTLEEYARIDETHGILKTEDIKKICDEIFRVNEIEFCMLFGPYAQGIATETSEIDLIIASAISEIKFLAMAKLLHEALHKRINLLMLEDLLEDRELLYNVLKDGVKIYGKETI